MSGDYDQTDQVSHGCFLRHCSNICHGPELVVFTLKYLSQVSLQHQEYSLINFSDHLPCFISMNIMSQKHIFTKFVNVSDYSHNNIIQLQQSLENANIYDELDHDLNNDPNENYNILENHI